MPERPYEQAWRNLRGNLGNVWRNLGGEQLVESLTPAPRPVVPPDALAGLERALTPPESPRLPIGAGFQPGDRAPLTPEPTGEQVFGEGLPPEDLPGLRRTSRTMYGEVPFQASAIFPSAAPPATTPSEIRMVGDPLEAEAGRQQQVYNRAKDFREARSVNAVRDAIPAWMWQENPLEAAKAAALVGRQAFEDYAMPPPPNVIPAEVRADTARSAQVAREEEWNRFSDALNEQTNPRWREIERWRAGVGAVPGVAAAGAGNQFTDVDALRQILDMLVPGATQAAAGGGAPQNSIAMAWIQQKARERGTDPERMAEFFRSQGYTVQ